MGDMGADVLVVVVGVVVTVGEVGVVGGRDDEVRGGVACESDAWLRDQTVYTSAPRISARATIATAHGQRGDSAALLGGLTTAMGSSTGGD